MHNDYIKEINTLFQQLDLIRSKVFSSMQAYNNMQYDLSKSIFYSSMEEYKNIRTMFNDIDRHIKQFEDKSNEG